jgi:hypothetical protein
MDQLIIDYIFDLCQVKSGTVIFFDGGKVYYDVLKNHLSDSFNLDDSEVDNYMITCFYDMVRDFDYPMFMTCLKPTQLSLYYTDYVYNGNIDSAIDWEGVRENPNRRYYGGIDPATTYGDIVISSRRYGELSLYPPNDAMLAMTREISEQTFNLELTSLDKDLDE